jgi:hypothetical protein
LSFGVRRLYEAGRLNAAVIVRAMWSGRSDAGMCYSDGKKQNASKNGDSNVKTGLFHFWLPNIKSAVL